jgi:hypothetical protein
VRCTRRGTEWRIANACPETSTIRTAMASEVFGAFRNEVFTPKIKIERPL